MDDVAPLFEADQHDYYCINNIVVIITIIESNGERTMYPVSVTSSTYSDRLARYSEQAHGALAENTERALRSDIRIFTSWCAANGLRALPASPDVIASFATEIGAQKKPATVRRYVSSISSFHRAAGLESPCGGPEVKFALKRLARAKGTRQTQAAGLTREVVDKMLEAAPNTVEGLRSRALLAVAYDTLARRSELVGINVEDLQVSEDGSGTVLIRRSKADQDGQGQVRYVAADTIAILNSWLARAEITSGPVFRRLFRGGTVSDERLDAGSVALVFRRMAARAGASIDGISGHSTRVGAAQDLFAAGIELPLIMNAGGWTSPSMPVRYGERLIASRGGVAKLAGMQGRV